MKKRERNSLKQVYKRKRMNKFKYGIEVPNTVGSSRSRREKNGNSLWQDAIAKEMKNVMVAFEVRIQAKPPDGWEIPLIMIFTIKMDFTRKARLVTDTRPNHLVSYLCKRRFTRQCTRILQN
jgi:hypothetical protein